MPFLDEQELLSLQEEIHKANVEKEEAETELETIEKELRKTKRSSRKINVLFGILSGVALALVAYFLINKGNANISGGNSASSIDIAKIKKEEAIRVIDSLQNLNEDTAEQLNSLEDDINSVKAGINNETIYSVQVGVFSKNKYALLSETLAGTTSQGEIFKYSVGLFKTLKEAQEFRKQIVKIGFEDAFVASYINGKRQKIHKPN